VFDRIREKDMMSASDEDRQIWYKTTQVYVSGIRRKCVEALENGDKRAFKSEAEKGAEILYIRAGAAKRAGVSDALVEEMEEAERLLREGYGGYADPKRIDRRLRALEESLEKECPEVEG